METFYVVLVPWSGRANDLGIHFVARERPSGFYEVPLEQVPARFQGLGAGSDIHFRFLRATPQGN